MNSLKSFGDTAKGLARNPIGIIALFIVLIYGFASLVVGFSGNLTTTERLPIVWFWYFSGCCSRYVYVARKPAPHQALCPVGLPPLSGPRSKLEFGAV